MSVKIYHFLKFFIKIVVSIFRKKNWHQILEEHEILHGKNFRWNFLNNWDIINSMTEKVPNNSSER